MRRKKNKELLGASHQPPAPDVFSDPEQLLRALLSAPNVGLAICDEQLHFHAVNHALAAMNGIPAKAHIGKTVREILGDAAGKVEPAFRQVFLTGRTLLNFQRTAKLPTRTEEGHWIENYFPLKDSTGRVKQVAAMVVEVTEQKRLEALLQSLTGSLGNGGVRLQTLLELACTLITNRDKQKLLPAIGGLIRRMIRHDCASVAVYNETAHTLSVYPLDGALSNRLGGAGKTLPVQDTAAGRALLERETKIFSHEDLGRIPSTLADVMLAEEVQSLCCIPLMTRDGELGTLNLGSTERNAFGHCDTGLLQQVAAQVALALDNARAYQEIAELKHQLAKEKLYLVEEISTNPHFEEIVGESAALKRALSQAQTVAPSDATVLILGDTGTGKELLARAIHRMSARKDAAFVKLNCAAIPTGLLESELFGHEKGAFTGAISQKIGRLELADHGTLFLDEVGDIPLELQPKLLRVLQDYEFERLGSTRTICMNIRLIVGTNRDLAKSVAEKEFRNDLYYRLNVFPIRMPSLLERRTDIPLLVRHFVQKFARRMDKQITRIPTETMNALTSWPWPGNVRELENFLERSVILSAGPELTVPMAELGAVRDSSSEGTLESLEREHIVRVLKETRGVVSGPQGAAARLGLKRTTLQSKILRLGIAREEYAS